MRPLDNFWVILARGIKLFWVEWPEVQKSSARPSIMRTYNIIPIMISRIEEASLWQIFSIVDLNLGVLNEYGIVSAASIGGLLHITDQFEYTGELTLHFAAGFKGADIRRWWRLHSWCGSTRWRTARCGLSPLNDTTDSNCTVLDFEFDELNSWT